MTFLVGLLFFGPAANAWYSMIFKVLPSTSLISTLKKAILGQVSKKKSTLRLISRIDIYSEKLMWLSSLSFLNNIRSSLGLPSHVFSLLRGWFKVVTSPWKHGWIRFVLIYLPFGSGKSAFVLFYHVNSYVQYEVLVMSASFVLHVSSFDCLCKPYVLTEVTLVSLHLHKTWNAHLQWDRLLADRRLYQL